MGERGKIDMGRLVGRMLQEFRKEYCIRLRDQQRWRIGLEWRMFGRRQEIHIYYILDLIWEVIQKGLKLTDFY